MSLIAAEAEAHAQLERQQANIDKAEKIIGRVRSGELAFVPPPSGKDSGGAWNVWWSVSEGWRQAVELFAQNNNHVAAEGVLTIFDLALARGVLIDRRYVAANIEAANALIRELKQAVLDREKTLKSVSDELHDKDARIRFLEGVLVKNNISFGSEQAGVF